MNYIAIDIGGSSIKAAIVNSKGQLIEKMSLPTPTTNIDDLINELSTIVEWSQSLSTIEGIAISQPCVTDAKTGLSLSEGALVYIRDTNPAKVLGEKYKLPYAAENDGNCAALAEVWIGRGKNIDNFALVVCGSGIGGSVVLDKKIFHGDKKFAGEFGMCITEFDVEGKPVVWSESGSTLALVRDYTNRTGNDIKLFNGKIVFNLAENGDKIAKQCVEKFYRTFAYGVHNVQHIFDPELILLGGAISARPDFVDRINKELDLLYTQLSGLMSQPSLAICACGADANLIGAVYHLLQNEIGFGSLSIKLS